MPGKAWISYGSESEMWPFSRCFPLQKWLWRLFTLLNLTTMESKASHTCIILELMWQQERKKPLLSMEITQLLFESVLINSTTMLYFGIAAYSKNLTADYSTPLKSLKVLRETMNGWLEGAVEGVCKSWFKKQKRGLRPDFGGVGRLSAFSNSCDAHKFK